MKIIFSDLRNLATSIERREDQKLAEYFNLFEGDNCFQKFKNFMQCWEYDVSPNLDFMIDGENVKVGINYFLGSFPENIGTEIDLEEKGIKFSIDVPREFSQGDTLPEYHLLKSITLFNIHYNFDQIVENDRKKIIDGLPGEYYNVLVQGILKDREKTVQFNHPRLNRLRLNFLTNEPFVFLKSLLVPYGTTYFRDVIFNLSKRVDSPIIMDSTILDIEYFIERYNEEMKNSDSTPSLG